MRFQSSWFLAVLAIVALAAAPARARTLGPDVPGWASARADASDGPRVAPDDAKLTATDPLDPIRERATAAKQAVDSNLPSEALAIVETSLRDLNAMVPAPVGATALRDQLESTRQSAQALLDKAKDAAKEQEKKDEQAKSEAKSEAKAEEKAGPPRLGPVVPERNERVDKWMGYYTGRGREVFQKWLSRSGNYMDLLTRNLRAEGVPEELANLVFVESGFNPQALSRSRAVGPWQFIRGTAKIFGLKVNSWVDERKDPERATQAAAHYLKHLYSVFDSWPLALASYNAGEGTVVRAIARQGTKDFWQLSLPRETRDYVPKFLACLHIARNPEQYGFDEVPRAEPLAFETVRIPGPVDLNAVASACKTTPEDLRRLNPQFLRFAAPNDPSGMVTIRVPQGSADTLIAGLGDGTLSLPTVSTPPDPAYVRHKVRRGETLARVARRYGVSASELARANGLRTKSRLHRGQSLRVPNPDPSAIASRSSVKARSSRSHTGGGAVYAGVRTVKIRRGDTLAVIANRHGTSVRTLRALNNLRPREAIRAGASIKVPVQS